MDAKQIKAATEEQLKERLLQIATEIDHARSVLGENRINPGTGTYKRLGRERASLIRQYSKLKKQRLGITW